MAWSHDLLRESSNGLFAIALGGLGEARRGEEQAEEQQERHRETQDEPNFIAWQIELLS